MDQAMTCGHCGATDVGTPEAGYARGAVTGPDGRPVPATLCHPNVPCRPDCYRLVTVYRHDMPCAPCTAGVLAVVQGPRGVWDSSAEASGEDQ